MQTTLVEVLLADWKLALIQRTLHHGVFAVKHDMVVDVCPLVNPIASAPCVWTFDLEFVQHCFEDTRNGEGGIIGGIDLVTTGGAGLLRGLLGIPGMVQTFLAEVMITDEADGRVEGTMADEADEVAITMGDVLEHAKVGRELDQTALSALRRG